MTTETKYRLCPPCRDVLESMGWDEENEPIELMAGGDPHLCEAPSCECPSSHPNEPYERW